MVATLSQNTARTPLMAQNRFGTRGVCNEFFRQLLAFGFGQGADLLDQRWGYEEARLSRDRMGLNDIMFPIRPFRAVLRGQRPSGTGIFRQKAVVVLIEIVHDRELLDRGSFGGRQ